VAQLAFLNASAPTVAAARYKLQARLPDEKKVKKQLIFSLTSLRYNLAISSCTFIQSAATDILVKCDSER